MVPRNRVRNQSEQGASPVVYPQQQSSRTSNVSRLPQWRSHRTHEQSQIPRDPLRQNADVHDVGRINKLRYKKGLSALKAMASKGIEQNQLFLLYQSVILSVIDYGLGLTNLSQSEHADFQKDAKRSNELILGTAKDTPIETMLYLLDLSSIETRHKVEQVKAYLNAMQNPKNPFRGAAKEEKGVDWQDASHGWAKQNSQSSMGAA